MLGIVVILCILIIYLLYYYLVAPYNFWKKLNIPGPSPTLLFGTMKDVILGKTLFWDYVKNMYDAYENTSFIGIYDMREPILIIKDPEHIKDVCIKDAAVFQSRGILSTIEILNPSFFYANGKVAQTMRSTMSPILTPSKLKDMFYTMLKSMERLNNYLEEFLPKNNYEINAIDMTFKLTTDMVGNTLLGIDMQALMKDTTEGNEISVFSKITRETYWGNIIKTIIGKIHPRLNSWISYYVFNSAKTTQSFVDFIFNIMKHREEHGMVQSDVINLMMEFKKNRKRFAELCGVDITDEFIASQVFTMFFAAYETSAVTICNTLYALAQNQNVQQKLREEIQDVYARNNNKIQFESLNEMPYLGAVCKETLRKYPPIASIERQASSSYTFRNTNIHVPEKQKIVIPLLGFLHDPKIFPQPEIYDPERFMGENVQPTNLIYFAPFGYGSRNCIGERLGILQIKIALFSIVRNFKLDVCEKTATSLVHNIPKLVNVPDVDVFIKMTKIN